MRLSKTLSTALIATALVASSLSLAEAVELRAASKLARKVSFTAVSAASIVRVAAGRTVEGKVTFAPGLGGSPTGTAAQACARVDVSASKFTPGTGDSFGSQEVVKHVAASPVDAGDLSKGCKYTLAALPHSVQLSIDASYNPPTAFSPPCNGNIAQISTSKVMNLTLPNANVKVTLDLLLDYKYCGNLN